MIHGQKDEVVPTIYSKLVLKVFTKAKKKNVMAMAVQELFPGTCHHRSSN